MKSDFSKKTVVFLVFLAMSFSVSASMLQLGGGRLVLCNRILVDELVVNAGARLEGEGRVEGTGRVYGVISPGRTDLDAGLLEFDALSVFAGSTYACDVSGEASSDCVSAGVLLDAACEVQVDTVVDIHPYKLPILTDAGHTAFGGIDVSVLPAGWGLFTNVAAQSLCLIDWALDSDADGMPDWWEDEWFGDRVLADADGDADDDGMKNRPEFVAGTLPLDDTSLLRVDGIVTNQMNQYVARWGSVAGRSYTVWKSTNLITEPFAAIATNVTATPPYNDIVTIAPSEGQVYFRIEVEQE